MNEIRNEKMSVERWKKAVEAGSCQRNYRRERGMTQTNDDFFVDGVQWADEHPMESRWRPTTEPPADGEYILMKLRDGGYFFAEWKDDGKGFDGTTEIHFGNDSLIRMPIHFDVVAWRSLKDVMCEFVDHGVKYDNAE